MTSSVIHRPVPQRAVAEVARVQWGFHLGGLMGSYPRHQSYHDCPPRLCLSQQAQPANPSNIRRCHRPAFEGRKKKQQQILPERAIHLSPLDSVRCRQPSVCEQLQQPGLVGGLGRRMPACHMPAASCSHRVPPHFLCFGFKAFLFFSYRLCWCVAR